jgi:CheY-like chemotaxis protein
MALSKNSKSKDYIVALIDALPRLSLVVVLIVFLVIYSHEIKVFLGRITEVSVAGTTLRADLSDLREQAQSGPAPQDLDAIGSRVAILWAYATQRFLSGAEVLWVDDHPENNIPLRQVLTRYGVRVTSAASTAEALDRVKKQDFDAIISDISRDDPKDSDGLAFLEKLRELGGSLQNVPVIFYVSQKYANAIPGSFAIENMPDRLLLALSDALMSYRKLGQ